MKQLTGLKMTSGAKVTDFLTNTEGLKLYLAEAGELLSDALFTAMTLKGLPSDFDSVVAVLIFGRAKGRNEAGLGQLRSNQGSLCFQRDMDDSISLSREEASKMLQVWKDGNRAKDSHSRETRTCFNCGHKGHLASSWRMWLGSIQQPFFSGLLQLRDFQGWLIRQGER